MHSQDNTTENRLARETSPYLLQHAHNPVDWYPWGEEALERAHRENRPILLSIGYSACHWCHVMAHESFEDAETAGLMNERFVNIKVDREERPDLDRIYQSAHQLLIGRGGGWPLTVFLTPDGTPFFAGTYFPPEPRHGMPGFAEVLERVASFYRENPERITSQNIAVREALERVAHSDGAPADELGDGPVAAARGQLASAFDRTHGGFGNAPKFPRAADLELLLHMAAKGDREALDMADRTLQAMAEGGIYDQLGGGFYRYSVDANWTIPHFEKMLYDNGPLLAIYAEAWRLTGNPLYRQVATEVGTWAIREMQAPEGGFYATLDADSEGEEGKFYLWTADEVQRHLGSEIYPLFAARYGLDHPPNFEGHWHLRVTTDEKSAARKAGVPLEQAASLLGAAREKLLVERARRVRPGRDEKILTGWNGLMIRGLAVAGRLLGREDFIAAAEQALDFVRRRLLRSGRLLAAYKDGNAHLNGYLDDYAFMAEAALELLQSRWRDEDLAFVRKMADTLIERFQDAENGGFFFTSDDHETLIQRPKPLMDESLPSGNGIAARALARIGHLLGEPRLVEAAERTLRHAWSAMNELPYAHGALLLALEESLEPPQTVVLRGPDPAVGAWKRQAEKGYHPHRMVLAIPDSAAELPGALAHRHHGDGAIAYVCAGHRCLSPAKTLAELKSHL